MAFPTSRFTNSAPSIERISGDLSALKMFHVSNVLDQPSSVAPTYEAATAVFETNELLHQILKQLPREELVTVRRVSKTWSKVASEVGYLVEPYAPIEDRNHEHPTPHYPADESFKSHPILKRAVRKTWSSHRENPDLGVTVHVLRLENDKLPLPHHKDHFITCPPITKLDTCLILHPNVHKLIALRAPSDIKFKHLEGLWSKYVTPNSGLTGNGARKGFYACFMACDDCLTHVEIPDRYSNVESQPHTKICKVSAEVARGRSKIMESARQFGTQQEKFQQYQREKQEIYETTMRQNEAIAAEGSLATMASTFMLYGRPSPTGRAMWLEKTEYLASTDVVLVPSSIDTGTATLATEMT